MALKHYGVLKGRPISRRLGSGSSPHYQIRVVDEGGTDYRVAVNVKSRLAPSELMYHIKSHFVHPITAIVSPLASGFNPLAHQPEAGGLDYIRGSSARISHSSKVPWGSPGAGTSRSRPGIRCIASGQMAC